MVGGPIFRSGPSGYGNTVYIQCGTPPDEAVDKQNSQPHIVLFEGDDDDDDIQGQYFIWIELQLMMELSNLVTAIFNLLAAHYVLNHPKAKRC